MCQKSVSNTRTTGFAVHSATMTRSATLLGLFAPGVLALGWFAAACPLVAEEGAPTGSPEGEKWALLVGIDDYAEISDLKYCRRDIQMLGRRLIAAGFPEENIVLMHDDQSDAPLQPFRSRINDKLDELLKGVRRGDLVLFAFSGHGVHVGETSYLCPIEARLDQVEATGIALADVYARLAASAASRKILLVDACRNDPEPGGSRSLDTAPDVAADFVRGLQSPPEGMVVLSSCTPGQVSVEDDKMGHGVFMHFVLRGLAGEADRDGNENGTVSLFELFRYTSLRTRSHVARTRDLLQTPMLRGEITADFSLARVPRAAMETEAVWKQIQENAEQMAAESPVLRHLLQVMAYQQSRFGVGQVEGMNREEITAMQHRIYSSPEALVVANPSLITAQDPAALLALQRSYAFGVRGDYDGMIAAAGEAMSLEPENPFAYLLRGSGYSARDMRRRMMATMLATVYLSMFDDMQGSQYDAVRLQTLESILKPDTRKMRGMDLASELLRANPRLLDDLRAARGAAAKSKELLEAAVARVHDSDDLKRAIDDYARIGLHVFGMYQRDVKKTPAFATGEMLRQEGDRVAVRGAGGPQSKESWVPHNRIVPVSMFQYVDMIAAAY